MSATPESTTGAPFFSGAVRLEITVAVELTSPHMCLWLEVIHLGAAVAQMVVWSPSDWKFPGSVPGPAVNM